MKAYVKKKALEKILIRKNKSQNWFAYRLEVSSGYMSQLMNGLRTPSAKLRQRIMDIFPDLCFDELFIIKDREE